MLTFAAGGLEGRDRGRFEPLCVSQFPGASPWSSTGKLAQDSFPGRHDQFIPMLRLGGLFVAFRSAKKCLFSVCDPALFRGAKGDNARDLTFAISVGREEVSSAIAIQILNGHRTRSVADAKRCRGSKRAVPISK